MNKARTRRRTRYGHTWEFKYNKYGCLRQWRLDDGQWHGITSPRVARRHGFPYHWDDK